MNGDRLPVPLPPQEIEGAEADLFDYVVEGGFGVMQK